MFTRAFDDSDHIRRQSETSSYTCRYVLTTPGHGLDLPFHEDPHIRLQQWGNNFADNAIAIDSDLRGLTRVSCRDHVEKNRYDLHQVTPVYSSSSGTNATANYHPITEQSRATHPAWMYRVNQQNRWEVPPLNPQAHTERPFHHNIQTRILEKDQFRPTPQTFAHLNCHHHHHHLY